MPALQLSAIDIVSAGARELMGHMSHVTEAWPSSGSWDLDFFPPSFREEKSGRAYDSANRNTVLMPQIPGARHRSPGPDPAMMSDDQTPDVWLWHSGESRAVLTSILRLRQATPDPSSGGKNNCERAGHKNVFGRLRERHSHKWTIIDYW